ncbi:MAG: zinc dependent phospholipase C family protein [Deltaproteobacteria bacterium]|nr:zinc dependent phospholipase C family protein [Deltaproteobacteria bacterium]
MHLEIALGCLEKLPLATPAIAALLHRYPHDFLYGAVSPDIFLSKMRAGYLFHCHNWRMGKLLLSEATSDRLQASVFGYLVHLAADVVAHNYFVPYKTIRSFSSRIVVPHAYWEMRFDLTVPPSAWRAVPTIVRGNYQEFDRLLERVLKKTLFSFKTSKRIFKSILVIHKMEQLQESLRRFARQSRLPLEESRIVHFRRLVDVTVDEFLRLPDKARCLSGDPTGHPREMEAIRLMKRMRRAMRRRQLRKEQGDHLVALCDRTLLAGMYQRDIEWPDIFDVM